MLRKVTTILSRKFGAVSDCVVVARACLMSRCSRHVCSGIELIALRPSAGLSRPVWRVGFGPSARSVPLALLPFFGPLDWLRSSRRKRFVARKDFREFRLGTFVRYLN
jgi:hypothetical protein